jgi:hypothetical protein
VASLTGSQSVTLGAGLGTLGYEWDTDPDNGSRPPGEFDLSSTTSSSAEVFIDYGSQTMTNQTATHHLSLYRAPSGALVFGAGTVQFAWGLGDLSGRAPDQNMRQMTVNLFADMGAQPATLESGLVAASSAAPTAPPTTTISSPASGSSFADGSKVTISGTNRVGTVGRRRRRGVHRRRFPVAPRHRRERRNERHVVVLMDRAWHRPHLEPGGRRQRQPWARDLDGPRTDEHLFLLGMGHERVAPSVGRKRR